MPEHQLPRRAMLTSARDGWKKVRVVKPERGISPQSH
ncbi:unnamed protein product [Schistosoma mattheei]|uniref:Uncharacterized protein n=1 Tax=Schistosoma mattheei TaxID=31246 RepID=A0A183P4L5_9TREM|nr:unnamed protein product [Schistosoma mattheei]